MEPRTYRLSIVGDPTLRSLFRALVRYNYSEWEYNTHMGGDRLEELLLRENPITAYDPDWDVDSYEDALLAFIKERLRAL